MNPTPAAPRPRSGLTPREAKRSLAIFNVSASLRSVFDSICAPTGFVFVAFALSLGIAKEHIGYLASILSLACLFQLVGLMLTNYVTDKRRFALALRFIEPVIMIAAVLATALPLVAGPGRVALVGVAVFMAAATLHMTRPTTDEWLASTIPPGIRGRYLGRSTQLACLTAIVVTPAVGYIAQSIPADATGRMALFLAVGGLFGVLAVTALGRASMPLASSAARVRWADMPGVLRDRTFRRCALGILGFNLPFWLCAPYHQVFYLSELKMMKTTISFLMVGYFGLRVILSPLCGRLLDRIGPRRMIYTVAPLYLLFFLGFILSREGRIWPVFVGWAMAGLADAAYGVAASSALLSSVPHTPARPAYFAVYNLLIFAAAASGAFVAVRLVTAFKDVVWPVGPLSLGQFQLLYLVSEALMVPLIFSSSFFPGRRVRAQSLEVGDRV